MKGHGSSGQYTVEMFSLTEVWTCLIFKGNQICTVKESTSNRCVNIIFSDLLLPMNLCSTF